MIDKFPGTPAKSLNLLMLMMLMMLMPRLSLLRYALCIFHAECCYVVPGPLLVVQENLCIAEIMTQLQKVKQKHQLFSAQVSNICI